LTVSVVVQLTLPAALLAVAVTTYGVALAGSLPAAAGVCEKIEPPTL